MSGGKSATNPDRDFIVHVTDISARGYQASIPPLPDGSAGVQAEGESYSDALSALADKLDGITLDDLAGGRNDG